MVGSPGVCALFITYLIILSATVWSPEFRDAFLHLQKTELLIFWAFGGILPTFVTLTLILGIFPSFAGDIQSHTKEEFSACALGRGTLCKARAAASCLFTVLINFFYQGITFLTGVLPGQHLNWQAGIETVYRETKLKVTISTYYALAIFLIFSGSLVVAALTVYASSHSKTTVASCTTAVIFWASEYALQKLSGANPITNYLYHINVCKAMNPALNLYPGTFAPFDSPTRAMKVMLISFGVAVELLLWRSTRWRRKLI